MHRGLILLCIVVVIAAAYTERDAWLSSAYGTKSAQAQSWQHLAPKKYPELGVPGSPFNRAFLTLYGDLRATGDPVLISDDWPVTVADRCAAQLNAQASSAEIIKPRATFGSIMAIFRRMIGWSPEARVSGQVVNTVRGGLIIQSNPVANPDAHTSGLPWTEGELMLYVDPSQLNLREGDVVRNVIAQTDGTFLVNPLTNEQRSLRAYRYVSGQ